MAETFISGSDIFVFNGTSYFGHSKNCSIDLSADKKARASKDIVGGWNVSAPGKKSLTISVSGLVFMNATEPGTKMDNDDIIEAFIGGTQLDVKYKSKTGTDKFLGAKMYISSYKRQDNDGEDSTYDVTLELMDTPTYTAGT